MSCDTKIEARRNGDLRITYQPSRGYSFASFAPVLTIRDGVTTLLEITTTPTVSESVFTITGDALVLTIKEADILVVAGATPATERVKFNYDIVLTDTTGIDNWLLGGLFVILGINEADCCSDCGNVEVSVGGECVQVSIEGGNIGAGASVFLADLSASVQAAQDAEDGAQEAAAQGAGFAAAAAQSASDAEAAAASIPGLIVNKADTDGGNVLAASFRSSIESARIPTAEKYGTAQAAAIAALTDSLPFFEGVNNAIAITCADGRLDLLCRKIGGWPIGDQGRINITVPAGKYTFTAGQRVSFPFGQRVQIAGAAPTVLAYSSIFGVVDNGTRDHLVTIEVASGAAVSVGDTIEITAVNGTGECGVVAGQFPVVAKPTANRITLQVRAKAAALGAMTVTSMTIVKMNSVLEFQGSSGVTLHGRLGDGSSGAQPGGFRDIAITGNNTGTFNGLVLEQGTCLVTQGRFGVSDFGGDNIYGIYGSVMYSVFCCSSNSGGNGVYFLSGGVFQGVAGAFTGNNTFGVYGAYGTVLAVTNASASGNLNGIGTLAGTGAGNTMQLHGNTSAGAYGTGGYLDIQGSDFVSNGGVYGVRARGDAEIKIDNATFSGHGTDVYAEGPSCVEAIGTNATTFSPAVNTIGPNGGAVILTSLTALLAASLSSARVTDTDPRLFLTNGANTASRISGALGNMRVISQSVNRDVYISYDSAGTAVDVWQFDVSASAVLVGGVQILSTRKTGWTADTGTAKRTANATYTPGATLTYSATYVQAEQTAMATRMAAVEAALRDATQTIKALKDDIIAHGLIGT